jgi:hypothetical protein
MQQPRDNSFPKEASWQNLALLHFDLPSCARRILRMNSIRYAVVKLNRINPLAAVRPDNNLQSVLSTTSPNPIVVNDTTEKYSDVSKSSNWPSKKNVPPHIQTAILSPKSIHKTTTVSDVISFKFMRPDKNHSPARARQWEATPIKAACTNIVRQITADPIRRGASMLFPSSTKRLGLLCATI